MDAPAFAAARRRWARTDPILAAIAKQTPTPRRAIGALDPFPTLVQSIVHQQVSMQAGATIFARVEAAAGGKATPEGIAMAGPEALRSAGLSRSKVVYATDLAERVLDSRLDLDALPRMTDAEIVDALTEVKGIGAWTAKMFLIFHLGRPDVLPHEDLGIQLAAAKAYGVPRERVVKKLHELAPAWSPYASLASIVLWDWRRLEEPAPSAKAKR